MLSAAVNLAFKEGLLAELSCVELLPEDEARPIVPPSDTELSAIVNEASRFEEHLQLELEEARHTLVR